MTKNFALMGAAGYIAPRHLKAMKEVGGDLLAALDKNDSVGVLDSYFPETSFFTEFERFDRHLEKQKAERALSLDYVSICTPNYLHDAHIRAALRSGAHAICEKPLVLNPWNLEALLRIEQETKKKVYTILQLRLHKSIKALKEKIAKGPKDKIYDVDLTYLTSRGNWYYASWKGEVEKSGGIASNIGVHFFDMLGWVFGPLKVNHVHVHRHDRAAGYLEFKQARVKWFLSIDYNTLPREVKERGQRTYRSIRVAGEEIEFSGGFTELHTQSYQEILSGRGFGLEDARSSIEIVHAIRNAELSEMIEDEVHPLSKLPLAQHPFKR
jgi:UDP-N-acetyl-2-amino-2-deoxyglucuronate dehydrogenase